MHLRIEKCIVVTRMAPRKRKRDWRSKEEKERRKVNCEVENEKSAYREAMKRCEKMVDVKIEREKIKYPKPSDMSEEVKNCLLVKAMDDGYLNFLRGIRIKDKSSLLPIILSFGDPLVLGIRLGLKKYREDLDKEVTEERKMEIEVAEFSTHFTSKFTCVLYIHYEFLISCMYSFSLHA